MKTYEKKIQEQIEQFNKPNCYQNLPEIFHYWSNKYVVPMLQEVFGVNNNIEFYVKHISDRLRRSSTNQTILSIGCGECDTEIIIASQLINAGSTNFSFECLDLSPISIERALANIQRSNLSIFFHARTVDLNHWTPSRTYGAIMANHSLHHIVELERIFEGIQKALSPQGVFLTNDMIGRNGHMRWPECETIIQSIWAFLPDRIKLNRLRYDEAGNFRLEKTFRNIDCSTSGFEGVRAQDILPLLTKYFHFRSFLAFGNLQDVFLDRCFGHNFNPSLPEDLAFVDFLELLNNLLVDLGYLKPTIMFAVLDTSGTTETRHYKNWTPDFCIRYPDQQQETGRESIIKNSARGGSIFQLLGKLIKRTTLS